MPFAAIWMDLEMIILNEVSQRKINVVWYHLYVESNLQNRGRLIEKTQNFGYQRDNGMGGDKLGVWD